MTGSGDLRGTSSGLGTEGADCRETLHAHQELWKIKRKSVIFSKTILFYYNLWKLYLKILFS